MSQAAAVSTAELRGGVVVVDVGHGVVEAPVQPVDVHLDPLAGRIGRAQGGQRVARPLVDDELRVRVAPGPAVVEAVPQNQAVRRCRSPSSTARRPGRTARQANACRTAGCVRRRRTFAGPPRHCSPSSRPWDRSTPSTPRSPGRDCPSWNRCRWRRTNCRSC